MELAKATIGITSEMILYTSYIVTICSCIVVYLRLCDVMGIK